MGGASNVAFKRDPNITKDFIKDFNINYINSPWPPRGPHPRDPPWGPRAPQGPRGPIPMGPHPRGPMGPRDP